MALNEVNSWKLEYEVLNVNKSAQLIARTVTLEDRQSSYVAIGDPPCLRDHFASEKISTSV